MTIAPSFLQCFSNCLTKGLARPAALLLALGVVAPLAQPGPARAEERQVMRFTASVLGLTAGRMTLSTLRDGETYAVAGQTVSAGLAGLFTSFKVTNRVNGTVRGSDFRPSRYESVSDGERAGRGAVIEYRSGVPKVLSMAEELEPDAPVLDPAQQGGKVDPLTVTYALFRDVPRTEVCALKLEIFDGHRASRISLANPVADDDAVICEGLYRRVDGYPPDELAKRQDFAFTLRYEPMADGQMRPVEMVLDSLFGAARITRD